MTESPTGHLKESSWAAFSLNGRITYGASAQGALSACWGPLEIGVAWAVLNCCVTTFLFLFSSPEAQTKTLLLKATCPVSLQPACSFLWYVLQEVCSYFKIWCPRRARRLTCGSLPQALPPVSFPALSLLLALLILGNNCIDFSRTSRAWQMFPRSAPFKHGTCGCTDVGLHHSKETRVGFF